MKICALAICTVSTLLTAGCQGPAASHGLLAAPLGHTADFAACPQHFPGLPPTVARPGKQVALCFEGFAVLYSGESKTPIYSVERLTRASVLAAQAVKRVDRFYPEARLPIAYRAQLEDYRGSGYDRGHMAPAGDMPTESAKAQSFSLANMVPQNPQLNQHAWNQVEQATRKYVLRAPGDVFVFTGPFFGDRRATVGPGRVWVPSATWKLVYTPANGRAWAYWMENTAGPHSLEPIEHLEVMRRVGLVLGESHCTHAASCNVYTPLDRKSHNERNAQP